ncbi:YbaN family protein [Clostridium ihumii]|uniref:YbaN family protein n=1 Tax=Clostridium ihumii TaxID=1470356 RepID=UPI003D345719
MDKIKKYIYIVVGIIAFILGTIGVVLPILPTTPFYLLASFCFVRGSTKFDNWFKNTKLYKKHLESFVSEKSMTLKEKIYILVFADTMILIPIIIVDSIHVRIFLMALIIIKFYYFIFKIKTVKKNSQKSIVKGNDYSE